MTLINNPPPLPAPTTETGNKVKAASRYVASNAMGAAAILMVLAGLPKDQAASLLASLNDMYTAVQDFIGAFGKVWFLIFPAFSVWLAKMGVDASGFGVMIGKVLAAAKSGNTSAQAQVIHATGSLLSEPKAVPSTAAVTEVKAALIDATAALPEVVGKINVTDDKLADATFSNQVVKTQGMAA